ncbi:MAG: DUF58 domain-containing protein [Halanaerobiaceae bacterium]
MDSLIFTGIILILVGMMGEVHILYFPAYFCFLLYSILRFYQLYVHRYLEIKHEIIDDYIFLHEKSRCRVEIINHGILPIIWLKVREKVPKKLRSEDEKGVFFLKGGEKRILEFSLRGRRRGYYRLGPVSWEAGDIFGFFSIQDRVKESNPLTVFPRLYMLEELGLPSRLPLGEIKWDRPLYRDPARTAGVREYNPGDNTKFIHWRVTARHDQLMVREFEATVSLEAVILLNMNEEDYGLQHLGPKIELAVSAAASITHYLMQVGQSFQLVTNGDDPQLDDSDCISIPVGRGEEHLQQVLEILARIETSEQPSIFSLLERGFNLSWGSTIIIITNQDTEGLMTRARELVEDGYQVKILLLGKKVLHREFLHRPYTAALTLFRLRKEDDIYDL